MTYLGFVLFLSLSFVGCDELNKPQSTTAQGTEAPTPPKQPLARRVNVCDATNRFHLTEAYPLGEKTGLALDSCTGQLCRTWDWGYSDKRHAQGSLDSVPTCVSLYLEPAYMIRDRDTSNAH